MNIISRGYPTYELYGYPDDFALFPARFLTTDEGDGTVTADSAFVPGSERAFIESPHDRLFLTCVESGLLKFYINQAWAPTQSPPVVEKVVANAPPNDLIAPIPLVRPPQPTGPKRGIPRHR